MNSPWLADWIPECGRGFLDVGAHEGEWTRWLAGRFEHVYAIEPLPSSARRLAAAALSNVTVLNVAAWNQPSKFPLDIYGDTLHVSAKRPLIADYAMEVKERFVACGLTLDSLDLPVPIDFLKCDTEGAEVEVLQGARQLLERCHPQLILEIHSVDNLLEITSLLAQLRYSLTTIRHPYYPRFSPLWHAHCWLHGQYLFDCRIVDHLIPFDPITASSGRRGTLLEALARLHTFKPSGANIVEIGTTRNTAGNHLAGDGWATYFFAHFAQNTAGSVHSVDSDEIAIKAARTILGSSFPRADVHLADGVTFLENFDRPIDLLYLDASDSPDVQYQLLSACREPPAFVLVDDVHSFRALGKAQLVLPRLLDMSYRLCFLRDKQALLEKAPPY